MTRRELLKRAAAAGGAAVLAHAVPPGVARAVAASQQPPRGAEALAAMRRQMAAAPIEATKVRNLITAFSGPGGNVVVRHGEAGKIVVDTFVEGAFAALKERLNALGDTPVLHVINTHWHFDHTDNNRLFRELGAEIVAHENTRRRLSESHELLGLPFAPAPPDAMPAKTFTSHHLIRFEPPATQDYIDIGHMAPAHTDGDVYVHFALDEVLVLGDVFVNGSYPLIDAGTGGNVKGMIAAIEDALHVVNPGTSVVPGHGPVADRSALLAYRDMLVTISGRVQTLKAAGLGEREVVARKPTADFDATWGAGLIGADTFVASVYNTL